jgi:CHAT domain-containing protein/Tfp pilus assembly protein PilF
MQSRRANAVEEFRPLLKAAALFLSVVTACAPAYSAVVPRGAAQEQKTPAAPKELGQLRPGEPSRQEMDGGDVHNFRVALASGQYARAVVEQQGIDVVVSFLEPGTNRVIVRMDAPNWRHGPESVSLVAPSAGEYVLEVRSENKGAMSGRYEARLEALREPTEADLQRVRAEAAFVEAERLRKADAVESSKQALTKYTEALTLWRALGDRYEEACTLQSLGRTYHRARGRLDAGRENGDAARDYLSQSLRVFGELNDLFGQAIVNDDMGAATRDLGNPRDALPFYEQAYGLYERAGDQPGKANTHNNVGFAYERLGDFQTALGYLEQSLSLWRAARDRDMEANAYNNIAGALESLGDPTQALAKYQQALGIWQETGSPRIASAYNNVAAVSHGFGDVQTALDNYERALALQRERKNAGGEANVLNNVGMAYADMGDTERALDYFNEALPIWRGLGQPRGQAQTLDNLGYACYLLGRYAEALAYFQQARKLFADAGSAQGESYVLTHTGMLYAARGDSASALGSYEQAMKIQRKGGLKLGLAVTLDKLANAYGAAGDQERAASVFREALALWTDLGEERGRAMSLYGLARVERSRGDLEAARERVGQAIKIVESLRTRTDNQQLRTTLLASTHDYYELDIDVKMRLGEKSTSPEVFAEAAFESSEQARARSLIDLLAEGRADVRAGASPALAARERELERQLRAVSDRLLTQRDALGRAQAAAPADGKAEALRAEIESLKKKFDDLSAEYDQVGARMRSQSPRYAQLTRPAAPDASRLEELLDPDTLLLEYSLGDERSYLWALTSAGVRGYKLRGRAEIRKAAEEFRELIASYGSPKSGEDATQYLTRLRESYTQYRLRAAELGRMLLGPVAGRIGSKRLVIVADGALQFIPFEALLAPVEEEAAAARRPAAEGVEAQPLGVTNEVVYLPSASTLAALRAERRGRASAKNVAVFADPVFDANDQRVAAANRRTPAAAARLAPLGRALKDVDLTTGEVRLERLRYTLDEADAIAAVAPAGSAMKAVSFGASREKATDPSVGGYRIVHFATHALLDDKRPELSGLVMSLVDEQGRPRDGFLRLGDIYNLNLPVDLVVLSACRTGIGTEVRGEGLIGLTRGFMYAGASGVVASLWKVDDEATAELMKSFYRHMLKEGLPAAAALRRARSDVMQARAEWRAPYFWAGFVLQGDWGRGRPDRAAPKRESSSGTH